MEDNKPTYEEVEVELNEYKELLWQLSDEYKENVTAAEKKVEAEVNKRVLLEKKLVTNKTEDNNSYISSLGLPACILDKDGKIVKFNNKFKFLIELLFLEVEEITTIQLLLVKDDNMELLRSFSQYLDSDDSLYQIIYTVPNSFQGTTSLVLRIYRNENNQEHLALFVELRQNELSSIRKTKSQEIVPEIVNKPIPVKETKAENSDLMLDIKSYVKRHEISTQLLSFVNKKINDKTENISLIREIYNKIEKSFNLGKETKALNKSLTLEHKDFITRIKKQYPLLTANELKQCILIRTNLTYKEIAALMDISVNGVKIARNRLRKKLKLDAETKTSEFILKI